MLCGVLSSWGVSDVCQINEVDHSHKPADMSAAVSDVCQINEVDHLYRAGYASPAVSDVCQINEVDHWPSALLSS